MPHSASQPAALIPDAPEAPAAPASSSPWHLRVATPADVPALAALYANCARTLGPSCYTPEQVAAWASFGADLAGFADYVLKADTWLAVAATWFGIDQQHRDPAGAAPLGFSGVDDSGEVKSLYVRPDMMRHGLACDLLAHGLARAQARGLQRFTAWATPFSLPVFQRAGFVLVERVRAEFAGAMFERIRVTR